METTEGLSDADDQPKGQYPETYEAVFDADGCLSACLQL